MSLRLDIPAAPNLPVGTNNYQPTYQEALNNVHRLFYNRLVASMQNLTGPEGGRFLNLPYAAVQRTTDQTFAVNTATQVTFDTNDYINGCTNDGTDGIHAEFEGIYNYQFSVQLRNTAVQIHSAWIWLRVNGTDVTGTASKFDVTSSHGGVDGFNIAAANFYVQLNAGDYVEMWAAVDNVAISFDATAAQTTPFVMPSIPSVVATLSFVSSIPL